MEVYVIGTRGADGYQTGAYWRNGSRVNLDPPGPEHYETVGLGLAVCDGHTYAVGNMQIDLGGAAPAWTGGIWRDGVPEPYARPSGNQAMAIAVADDGVHVAGLAEADTRSAIWWSDGEPTVLESDDARATAVAVEAGAVYVAGWRSFDDGRLPEAQVWKDGALLLTIPGAMINAIAVVDGTVHSIGYGQYWVNEAEQSLAGSTAFLSVRAVDGDVYIAGQSLSDTTGKDVASFWKNGERVDLTDGSYDSSIQSIDVWDGQVYALGTEGIDEYEFDGDIVTTSEPRLWLDGAAIAYPVDEPADLTGSSLVLAAP